MKTTKTLWMSLICLMAFGPITSAFAYLPTSAYTQNSIPIYGFYTTADPTCQSGLVATIPLSKTATTFEFNQAPTLGSGSVSNPINCAIMVVGGITTLAWSAGTYTGTTFSCSDTNCNSGGTLNQMVCSTTYTPNWPAQITSDAAAVGLTLTTSTCTGTSADVVPIYMSTDSGCPMNLAVDPPTDTNCWSGAGPYTPKSNPYQAPTGANDYGHGVKLTVAPSLAATLTFEVNPSYELGGKPGGCSCSFTGPPVFSFHN